MTGNIEIRSVPIKQGIGDELFKEVLTTPVMFKYDM